MRIPTIIAAAAGLTLFAQAAVAEDATTNTSPTLAALNDVAAVEPMTETEMNRVRGTFSIVLPTPTGMQIIGKGGPLGVHPRTNSTENIIVRGFGVQGTT